MMIQQDSGATLKQVKDVVNKGAKPADPAPAGMKRRGVRDFC